MDIPVGVDHGAVKMCFECDVNYTDAPAFTECIMCGGPIETYEF